MALYELSNGNIAYLGRRNNDQCLIKILSNKGKELVDESFAANALICEPIDIVASQSDLIFIIKLDNFYKLLHSDMKGKLTQEYDFNPQVVADIACIYPVLGNQNVILITGDNLGQKKDVIITQIK